MSDLILKLYFTSSQMKWLENQYDYVSGEIGREAKPVDVINYILMRGLQVYEREMVWNPPKKKKKPTLRLVEDLE